MNCFDTEAREQQNINPFSFSFNLYPQMASKINFRMQELSPEIYSILGLVWFLCLMAYQLFLGYLMPKPFS